MAARKPKAPQYYNFNAALNVRPPFFEIANKERLQECGSLLAEPGWPDGYARLPRHPWRLPDYREAPFLLFDKKFGRPARDLENFDGLWFVTSAMKALIERIDPESCDFRECATAWTSGESGPEYWLCSVTRMLFGWDVIDLEKSKKLTVDIRPDGFPSYRPTPVDFVHLKPEAIGSAHLFRIVGLGGYTFCDEAWKDACKEAGIKGGAFSRIGRDHW